MMEKALNYGLNEVFDIGRNGTMEEKQITSQYLNETMTLTIYKPGSFSPLYKYYICIMQDGNDYYQLGRAATLSDRLHAEGDIADTIFVGIHYRDKYDRRNKYHPDGEQQEAYIQFLVREVAPFLDELLPSYYMAQTRALAGDSLAGTLGLMTALKYPNTFGNVLMQSPYVDEKVTQTVKEANGNQAITVYHTIGTNETAVDTTDGAKMDFLTPNRDLYQLLREKELTYTYHELPNGEHTWKFWQKDLKRAFISLFN